MIYLAACSRADADTIAGRLNLSWPDYQYIGSIEHLRSLRPNITLWVYDGDQIQDVIMRLRGRTIELGASRLTPILLEASRRGLTILPIESFTHVHRKDGP